MKKKTKQENTRKTVYLKQSVADKITDMASNDSRTFSSYVALLLEGHANTAQKASVK